MRPFALGGVLVWVSVVVAACSGESASVFGADAGTDAGNPPSCPSTSPTPGGACGTDGLRCSYGCNVTAACNAGTWSVVTLGIPCLVDSGNPDGPRRLPDGAIVCSSDPDCRVDGASFMTCSPGGRITGCGVCFNPPNPCNSDNECILLDGSAPPKPMVCEPAGGCSCPAGGKSGSCVPACQNANDCGPNFACAGGHCVPKPCTGAADCTNTSTGDFACSAAGKCGPKACASDADCAGHYCIDKLCYPQSGVCVPPAA